MPDWRIAWLVLALVLLPAPAAAAGAGGQDYCNPVAANIVVFVDRTTPYDDIDKVALIDGVSRLFESLSGGERFVIRTIAESHTASAQLLAECVPYCPPGGPLDILFSTCTEGVVINDRKRLRDAVVLRLRDLVDGYVELPNSEILRTIALTGAGEVRNGQPSRFYLFTDLIENSTYLPGKLFLNERNDVLLEKVAADGLVPALGGADIRIFGVGRGGTAERRPLDQPLLAKITDFWRRYFAATGATATIQQSLGAI